MMTTTTASPKVRRNVLRGFQTRLKTLTKNPVSTKELRSRMRGRKAFVILTIHLMVLSGMVTLIYYGFARASSTGFGPRPQDAGKAIFGAVVLIQAIMVLFFSPAATAGAITGEKERQTYEILRTTLLSANDFVNGKLLSGLSYVFLLVIASIPLQSIAFLLGGVELTEIIIAQVLIIVSAVAYALLGLLASGDLRSTLAASVASYGTVIFFTLGIPGIMILIAIFLDSFSSGVTEIFFTYIMMGLVSLNLPAALITSEMFLLEEGTLIGFSQSSGGITYWIPSPWYVNLFVFALLSFILYKVVVRRVRRIPS